MNSVPLQVLLYAFVAGASPVALGATLVVLGSRGGRWNALSFAVGVVIGQVLLCAVAYAVGSAAMPVGHHAHETARALLELALGVALLIAGAMVWSRPDEQRPPKPDSRAKAVLERLAHLNLLEVFGAGAVLALGPKRLGLTVLVTATIAGGNLGAFAATSLTAVYVVIATILVTLPVVLAIMFGDRGERWMLDVEHWLSAHKRPLTFYPVTILGVLVTVDALFGLLS
ncbi:MAG TPA: GAP family protein [Acidimicrobiia bacterium]